MFAIFKLSETGLGQMHIHGSGFSGQNITNKNKSELLKIVKIGEKNKDPDLHKHGMDPNHG